MADISNIDSTLNRISNGFDKTTDELMVIICFYLFYLSGKLATVRKGGDWHYFIQIKEWWW